MYVTSEADGDIDIIVGGEGAPVNKSSTKIHGWALQEANIWGFVELVLVLVRRTADDETGEASVGGCAGI